MGLKALTGSIAAITGGNVKYVLSKCNIPFFVAPTGTMANNGAVTLGTALPATFTGGIYLHLPASAIQAGSSAGWYWTVMSSATVGTVFNSTYTSGTPVAGTATAFATTGPGAFAGETTTITGPSLTLPAATLGTAGEVEFLSSYLINNTAGAKNANIGFGATNVLAITLSSLTQYQDQRVVANMNSLTMQSVSQAPGATAFAGTTASVAFPAENTANAVTLTFMIGHSGAATDWIGLQNYVVSVLAP